MFRRHPITVLVGLAIAVMGVRSGTAQEAGPVFDEQGDYVGPRAFDTPVDAQPWVGWHGPIDDGLLGLRFGMDRFATARSLRERGLEGQHSRSQTQLFGGQVLGHSGEVLTEFRPDTQAPTGERLSRIQIMWRIDGLPNRAMALFERLDGLLASRYGTPLLAEEDGYAALDNGWGSFQRGYVGPQAKAYLVVEAIRNQRFRVVLSLESPQLHVSTQVDDEDR